MNHLLAEEVVQEILNDKGDDSVISFWKKKVRQSDEPESVIADLKEAVKASDDFDVWSKSLGNFVSSLSWSRSFSSTHLLLWGHVPGKLGEEKEIFQGEYDEYITRQQAAFNERMREKDKRDVKLFSC